MPVPDGVLYVSVTGIRFEFRFSLTDIHICRIKYGLHSLGTKGKNSGKVIQCQDTADRTGPFSLILKEEATENVCACNMLFTVWSRRMEYTCHALKLHLRVNSLWHESNENKKGFVTATAYSGSRESVICIVTRLRGRLSRIRISAGARNFSLL
jgi:hypothetical protein